MKLCRHHANHLAPRSLECDPPAHDVWIAAKSPLPQRMAQQHQLILARLVFTLVNRSPHLRLRSQNREPISRNCGARQPHGCLDPRQVEFAVVICRDFHGAALVPHDHVRTHRTIIVDRYQSVGLRIRQGAKQDAVHDAEDRCVRANSQHQRQNRQRGESRIPAYHTQSVSQVLPQIFQPHAFPHVSRDVFHQSHISKLSPRCALRILPLLTSPCPLSRRQKLTGHLHHFFTSVIRYFLFRCLVTSHPVAARLRLHPKAATTSSVLWSVASFLKLSVGRTLPAVCFRRFAIPL